MSTARGGDSPGFPLGRAACNGFAFFPGLIENKYADRENFLNKFL